MPIDDVSRATPGRIIFHNVPSGRNDYDRSFTLSGIESPLSNEVLNYFRHKLVTTLANSAFPVGFDNPATSPVADTVLDATTVNYQSFVSNSQIIATHLYDVQKMNNAPGVLAIAETRYDNLRGLAIVKLEHEEGARALPIDYRGEPTFNVEYLEDLMMTSKTRVFKAALFVQRGTSLDDIEGLVSDNQRATGAKSGIAEFFLHSFLGCHLLDDPAKVTRDFFDAVQTWINSVVMDPSKRIDYTIALLAEMQRRSNAIDPNSFATGHLAPEDCQDFVDHLANHAVPTTIFPKDTNLLSAKLRKMAIYLESGIMIVGSPDIISENIKVDAAKDGQAVIQVTDRVAKVNGRG